MLPYFRWAANSSHPPLWRSSWVEHWVNAFSWLLFPRDEDFRSYFRSASLSLHFSWSLLLTPRCHHKNTHFLNAHRQAVIRVISVPGDLSRSIYLSSGEEFRGCELWLSLLSWPEECFMGAVLIFIFLASVDQTNWIPQVGSSNKQVLNGLSSLRVFFFCPHAPPLLNPQTKGAILSQWIITQNAVSSKPQIGCPITLFVNENSKQF